MKLKQFFFFLAMLLSLGIQSQSLSIGPYAEVGAYPNLGFLEVQPQGANEVNVVFRNRFGYEISVRPGLFASYFFKNGMILELNGRLIELDQLFIGISNLESDGYYRIRTGLEMYFPIKKLVSEKTKSYFGFGAGYVGERIGVKGINQLEGFESNSTLHGMYLSGNFRFDINFTDWFTLSPRANLLIATAGRQKSVERSANDAPNPFSFETTSLDFSNAFNPSLGLGVLFRIFKKEK
jgi:hypothetical protein